MAMSRRILTTLRRTAIHAGPTVLGIIVLDFLLLQLMPGDAADVIASESGVATAETMAAVQALKSASVLDLSVGGAGLAAEAFRAGLVDDVHLFAHPVLVGGGTRALPDGIRLDLELVAQESIGGVVHTHHRVRR